MPDLAPALPPAVTLGLIAGSRSMRAPAVVARVLADRAEGADGRADEGAARPLAATGVAGALELMAAGEILGDKLPTTPDRVAPLPLAGRAGAGALAGAAVEQMAGRSAATGAVVGALAAVIGAEVTFRARRFLVRRVGLPDGLVAAAEDALVLAAARGVVAALADRTPLAEPSDGDR